MKHSPSVGTTLGLRKALILVLVGVASFHLAYTFERGGIAIVLFLYCLIALAALPSARSAFYTGLALGLAVYAPQLTFFWSIFGPPAVTLWVVLAFWIGLFLALSHSARAFLVDRIGILSERTLLPSILLVEPGFRPRARSTAAPGCLIRSLWNWICANVLRGSELAFAKASQRGGHVTASARLRFFGQSA
jgi:hypothetical protein